MPLTSLSFGKTGVADLSPLKGMKLTVLDCRAPAVKDLSPLKEMPLKRLYCDYDPKRDAAILRAITTLEAVNDKPAREVLKTVIGRPAMLTYEDLKVGTGRVAEKGQKLRVHYTGWLLKDGKKFDSSKDLGKPFAFTLGAGKVIRGWEEGIAGMKVGGKRKLTIPARLAYGGREMGDGLIPADSDLVFEVELLGIDE
jgi:FKBP-type peptidyl-prolyl cis-trans isomerase